MSGPVLVGVNDAAKPTGLLDTLEGAYSAGAGSGTGRRMPVVRKFENAWSDASTSFNSSSRVYKLFTAGHALIVSYKPDITPTSPLLYTQITNGSQDSIIDGLGDRIYALPFGAAVSGTQAGAGYGGTTATVVRISFHHEMDNDTKYGTAAEFKAAYRHFMARLKSRKPGGAAERIICLPIFTGQANNNGRAAQFYPGNTAADYCDELGIDPYFYGVSALVSFDNRLTPWQTWRDKNAPNRKLAVCETNRFDTAAASIWYLNTIVPGMLANPDVSVMSWFSSNNGDAGSVAKVNHADVWQAFVDMIGDAYAATQPVDTTPPPPPFGLSATAVDSSSVTLAWQRPSAPDLAGYKLSRDGAVFATITNPATLSYNVSGQTPGSSHAYRIAAYDTATTPNQSAFVGPVGTSVPLTVTHPAIAEPDPPVIDPATTVTVNGHDAALSATITDPAGGTITVTVDWGDGNTGTGAGATHSYDIAGTYQVQVTGTSSVSLKSTVTSFPIVIEDVPDVDRTLGKVSLWLPQTGQPVKAFGPKFRENLNLITDSFEDLFKDRQVQNADAAPIIRRPILSVTGGTFTDEDVSDDWPTGRTLLTITGGGGGSVPADGSITPAKLSFDPATQTELDAGLALKSDTGHTHTDKVTVGTIGRTQDGLLHGFAMSSFPIAAISNNGGYGVAAGNVTWVTMVAEIDATITSLLFAVASAGTGTGYTIRLHAANGTLLKTATAGSGAGGTDNALTGTGPQSVTIASQAVVRGTLYRVSFHAPAGVSGPSIRSTTLFTGSVMNMGLSAPDLVSATYATATSPSSLVLASGTGVAPLYVAAK